MCVCVCVCVYCHDIALLHPSTTLQLIVGFHSFVRANRTFFTHYLYRFRYSKASDQKASFGDKFIELANCTKGDLACLQNLDPFVAISLGDKASSAVGEDIIDRILEGGRVEDAFAMQVGSD